MENVKLIIEQIKLTYPTCVLDWNDKSDTALYLVLKPFGKLVLDNKLNIFVYYNNPYEGNFELFRDFFKVRLTFDNASTYIKKDGIAIFSKGGNDRTRSVFDNSIVRANNFITTAKSIEKFIAYNKLEESK